MAFPRSPLRTPAAPRVRVAVFAVGAHVYVANGSDGPSRVTLTDDSGKIAIATVGDGTEVAILGWRPGWGGSTRYRIRVTQTGMEGWLPVGNLRGTAVAVATASPPPAATPAPPLHANPFEDSGRRFGQRRE